MFSVIICFDEVLQFVIEFVSHVSCYVLVYNGLQSSLDPFNKMRMGFINLMLLSLRNFFILLFTNSFLLSLPMDSTFPVLSKILWRFNKTSSAVVLFINKRAQTLRLKQSMATLNYLINKQDGISEQGGIFFNYESQIRWKSLQLLN